MKKKLIALQCILTALAATSCIFSEEVQRTDVPDMSSFQALSSSFEEYGSSSIIFHPSSITPASSAIQSSSSSHPITSSSQQQWPESFAQPTSSSQFYSTSSSYAPGGRPSPVRNQKIVPGNPYIDSLYWDTTEVTQGEYFSLVNDRPWTYNISQMGDLSHLSGDNRPALMNYFEAVYFANRRSKAHGLDTAYSWTSRSCKVDHSAIA